MSPVTDHAVIRFFERVHGIDFDIDFPDARHDGERLDAICRRMEITHSDARKMVCPPSLYRWIRDGATGIRRDGYRLVVEGGMIVTTLINDRKRRRPRWHREREEIAA